METEAVAILIPLGAFVMFGYITQVLVEWRRQTQRVKLLTEFQTKLLERMGSGQEFAAFFQSSGGERFLETISLDRANPYDRVIRSLQAGIVSVCLGVGLHVARQDGELRRDRVHHFRHDHPVAGGRASCCRRLPPMPSRSRPGCSTRPWKTSGREV